MLEPADQVRTLRDEFAARAMQGLIGAAATNDRQGLTAIRAIAKRKDDIAQRAYEIADAMLEARSASAP